jgi:peptide/nickel transport system substrate-binding protein
MTLIQRGLHLPSLVVLLALAAPGALPATKADEGIRHALVEPPRNGGELRFVIRADPKTFDPHLVTDEPSEVVQYLTAGVLIRQNRLTQELEPALALSWKLLDGGKAIEFRLRTGVKFSDGTPFTANDVVHTMHRINQPSLHSPYTEIMKAEKGDIQAEAVSPSVVVVRVPGRLANLAELFDQITIVSGKSPRQMAATLGPFELAEYKAGSYVALRRNPFYWKKDSSGRQLPYLDSVRLDIQTNHDVELMRFRRGEVHMVNGLDAESFDRLSGEMPKAAVDLGPSLDSEQVWFNQVAAAPIAPYKREWFRSTEFRQAISMAINRDDLCRLVYRGHAHPAAGAVSPGNKVWIDTTLPNAMHSPAAAIGRLSKAGFTQRNGVMVDRSGHAVEFSVITNAGSKSRERMAALIQQDLAKIGIKLNVVPMDFPSLIERIARTFQYEACLLGQNIDLDPNVMLNVWRSSGSNHQWNPNQKNPETQWEAELDRWMNAEAAAIDPKKRKAAYDRVQRILAEQQPFIYLVHKNALVGISPKLINARPAVLRPQIFWNVDTLALSNTPGR